MKIAESLEVLPYSKAGFGDQRRLVFQFAIRAKSGVGSSTLMRLIRRCYGDTFQYKSGGGDMREIACMVGFTNITDFAEHNLHHPTDGFDAVCEKIQARFMQKNNRVLESRLAHINAPHAFKPLLVCDPDICAERMGADRKTKDFPEMSVPQIASELVQRDAIDNERYSKLYPGCIWKPEDFDCVIDTGVHNTPQKMFQVFLAEHCKWFYSLATENKILSNEMPPPHGVWMNL